MRVDRHLNKRLENDLSQHPKEKIGAGVYLHIMIMQQWDQWNKHCDFYIKCRKMEQCHCSTNDHKTSVSHSIVLFTRQYEQGNWCEEAVNIYYGSVNT